ncbi:MAG: hypothetical protein COV37_12620 [Bdellovibrio sp. CG11_big_fil_rev_8_21_14_0_20_39_38]|nr:MAG: hypothetical protein COW78_08320 [Bdellovibrio sp. CG22_combo_CG10-13_8_21_14_all_39_27]PIR34550.1 MAG: hypothetical protein COV37_12620 [Bdellovibrio sp. CG11_big_fil_rev_8_21_14_0_20_39_38]
MKVTQAGSTRNLSLLALSGVAIIIAISIVRSVLGGRINSLYTLQDGVQTCFGRMSQSYTAKIINDRLSQYLSNDFMKTTEDCFSEALTMTREKMTYLSSQVEEGLNALAEDAHWYHEKLNARSDAGLNPVPQNVILANLGTRFQKLEQKRNELLEVIEQNRATLVSRNNYVSWAFFALAPIILIFSGIRMWKEWSGEESSEEVSEATIQAQAPTLQQIDRAGPAVSVAPQAGAEALKKIDKMWEEFNREEVQPVAVEQKEESTESSAVNLSDSFAQVMDILSSKVFTTGIQVDFDIDSELRVLAKNEALEQIIYHIMMNAINSYEFDHHGKSLKVTTKKLGGTLLVSFIDRGRGFDKDFLKSLALGETITQDPQHLELMICRELVKEFQGLISFENMAQKSGEILGSKVELVLRIDPTYLEETKKSKLVSLVRGKKRDIVKNLNV